MKKTLSNFANGMTMKISSFITIIFCCLVFNNNLVAQEQVKQDTIANSKLRISILTCDAGEDIYTIWGHTAVRVVDSINNTDYVFNFGTFDFNTPNFIAKFMKGDLMYFITATTYTNFLYEYEYTARNVHEQELKLTNAEKEKWYQALQVNMIGNNRFYLYNFISDNCTTRIKDGLFKHAQINNYSIGIHSYREEVVNGTYKSGLGWVALGIDLLLGAVSDNTPNLYQEAFLPILLYQKIALNPKLVVATKDIQYNNKPQVKASNPITYLIVFLILYLFVSNWNSSITQSIARFLDITLLFLFGIGGALVLYMSQFSLHNACHENYNLIWLHPIYLLAIPLYFIPKKWVGYLGWLFFTTTVLFMFASHWIPQHLSNSVVVLMIIALCLQIRLIKRGSLAKYK
ncbi:MAG: hypothetical protein RLZ95_1031 [Bacteroidota bacterium]|jgi:Domain of unknown function (DUF4105)